MQCKINISQEYKNIEIGVPTIEAMVVNEVLDKLLNCANDDIIDYVMSIKITITNEKEVIELTFAEFITKYVPQDYLNQFMKNLKDYMEIANKNAVMLQNTLPQTSTL
jgi:hypothetical protein